MWLTRAYVAAGLLLLVLPLQLASAAPNSFTSASGVVWQVRSFQDQKNSRQQYFLSEGDGRNLFVVLQGSGCVPAFARIAGKANASTSLQDSFARVLNGRARLLVIEKPGILRNDPIGSSPGQSEGCSLAFRTRYSLADWGGVVQSALADYRRFAGPARLEALVGISEGTKTATWLVQHGFRGPVASFGGAGCDGDLAGMVARAVRRQRDGLPGPSLQEELHTLAQIRADPRAINRFAWGHTFLRWSSFGDQCARTGLEHHVAPVFLAYGTKDAGVDVTRIERLARFRQATSLPVTVMRVEGGDHGLSVGEKNEASEAFARFTDPIISAPVSSLRRGAALSGAATAGSPPARP
jgi:hypothetical protein